MLVRSDGDGVVAIGQPSHAWLSGQIARAWGNAQFARPEPWEEVCLAAEQHDVGMAEWDLRPQLHPQTGRPISFLEMALGDHLRLWSAAPDKLLTQSRYAALLVSLHGTTLYGRRDRKRMAREDAGAVRAYLAAEQARQKRLMALLGADRDQVERNRRLLFAWDGLSLALCLRWEDHVAESVPTSGAAAADVRVHPPADRPDGRVVLEPWPFAAERLTVRCEGRRLAARYATAGELHAAYDAAPPTWLAFALAPRGQPDSRRTPGCR